MTIKVKDVLIAASELLGIAEETVGFLSGEQSEVGERDVATLLNCFQTVESDLALNYLPLVAEEELVSPTGQVPYATLGENAIRILCVEDEWGNSVKYERFPEYIKTQAGKLRVTYAYAPSAKTISGESDYKTEVTKGLFAYGVAAEYALAVGELEAAKAWDKKYKDAVKAAHRARPCKTLRSRRWA